MESNFFKKSKLVVVAVVGAVLLTILPTTAANASYTYPLGSGSCSTPTAFIRSKSTGYTAHYRNGGLLGSWSNGIISTTRQSGMPPTWSSAKVTGQDGGTAPKATLDWALTGCGGLL